LGGTYPSRTINNAAVIAKVITGFSSGAGTYQRRTRFSLYYKSSTGGESWGLADAIP